MKKYNIYFRKKDRRYEGRIYKGREKMEEDNSNMYLVGQEMKYAVK